MHAVAGDKPNSRLHCGLRGAQIGVAAFQCDRAAMRDRADQAATNIFVPGPAQTRQTQHLALGNSKRHRANKRRRKVFDPQNFRASQKDGAVDLARFAAHDQADQFFGRCVINRAHAHHLPVAPHGHAIGDRRSAILKISSNRWLT